MCGIHGYVNGGSKDADITSFLTDGFVAGQVRGMDSSGIALIDTLLPEVVWQKLPVNGSMFIQDKYAKTLLSDAASKGMIAICHTRFATSGRINMATAHPFYVDSLTSDKEMIGVHNGTLSGWKNHASAKDFDVDSEWALTHIFNEGLDAFKDFTGAFCFVWWDNESDKVLNIALNDQRNMFVAFTTDGGMAYASEGGMLYWLLERNKLRLKSPIIQLKPDNWYKFNIDKPGEFNKTSLPVAPVIYYPTNTYAPKTTYVSVMDKVGVVLAGIADKEESKPAPVNQNKQLTLAVDTPKVVSKEEVKLAVDFGLQNQSGYFTPGMLDINTNEVWGIFSYNAGGSDELEGVIRNASNLPWDDTTTWPVTAIGMIDDDKSITVICSKPRLQVVSKNSTSSANVSNEMTVH